MSVEEHYARPMDMEWARDGVTGELFMVQARPETVQSQKTGSRFTLHHLLETGTVLARGAAIGDSIAQGTACVIRSAADIENFRDGAILVTEMTDPDWVPIMKRAAGIVTDHGGPTSHAAIVSRELGVPAVVGTGNATTVLGEGLAVTISCAEGDEGRVYRGSLAFETEEVDLGELPETHTKVMVNIASPAAAFQWWRLPADGVGLARMEFIISSLIRVHPMALVHPERVTDAGDAEQIRVLTSGYADPKDYFVDALALGIAKIAAPYHPRPVIVRLSDFKTNEYAHLIGGSAFEEPEENPMLGFRGASRYYDERYREGFALECVALKRVREKLGFGNIIVMIPFCRTPQEADRVLAVMAENGLVRGENGLQVYMMCEIPSNVVLAEKFATRFDGFSIGSNDLTQLVLGVDRDSAQLASLFDERDEAVMAMISEAIRKAHAAGIKIGICGQGPSNHPEFAAFLVSEGIDSISLNPDSYLRTVPRIAEAEKQARPGNAGGFLPRQLRSGRLPARAERAQRIEDRGQIHEFLGQGAGDGRDVAGRRRDHQRHAQPDPDPDALQRHLDGALADPHGGGHLGQVVEDDHDVGRLAGRRRAARTHRDPDVGDGQDGGVVDAVADHHDRAERQGPDGFDLVRRQALGADIGEPGLGRDVLGGGERIAGQHDRLGDAEFLELGQGAAGLPADRVAHHQGPGEFPGHAHVDGEFAAGQLRLHDAGGRFGHEFGLADHHVAAVEAGPDAVRGEFGGLRGGVEGQPAAVRGVHHRGGRAHARSTVRRRPPDRGPRPR